MIDISFISAILLLINIVLVSLFDLRYTLNSNKISKFKINKNWKIKEETFVPIFFPVKNEPIDLIIKKIEYIKNNYKNYENIIINFVFIDDTDPRKELDLIKYLENIKTNKYKEVVDENTTFYIYESFPIIYIFRIGGVKRKGAALDDAVKYFYKKSKIKYFGVYDFEWTVNLEYIEKAVKILENTDYSFVYWNRRTIGVDTVHRAIGIYVDTFFEIVLPSKQYLENISMVHGSCGIIKVEDFLKVGGFTPHITEDANLTVRFYINGYKGLYIKDWIEYGQNLPPNINMTIKTLRRWQIGTADVINKNIFKILRSKNLNFIQKISLIQMFTNLYSVLFISFTLLLSAILSIFIDFSFEFYSKYSWFFYFSIIYIISVLLFEYYTTAKRIYKKPRILEVILSLLFAWGLSSLTMIYYIRTLIFGNYNQWIVTKKKKESYYLDIYGITVVPIFLFITLFLFVYNTYWIIENILVYKLLSLEYIIIYLKVIMIGLLPLEIWVLSLTIILILQLVHMRKSYSEDIKDLLYVGIMDNPNNSVGMVNKNLIKISK